jgi:hypothetical protein
VDKHSESVDNVLLINSRSESVVIDKPIPLSVEKPNALLVLQALGQAHPLICGGTGTLADYNIQNESALHLALRVRPKQTMQIFGNQKPCKLFLWEIGNVQTSSKSYT